MGAEVGGIAGVLTQGVGGDANDGALVDEERRRIRAETGVVHHAIGIEVDEGLGVAKPRSPARVHGDERTIGQRAVFGFPGEDVVDGERIVFISFGGGRHVDHDQGGHQVRRVRSGRR